MHLITDKEITGIDERLDRLIALQLHYCGELKAYGENTTRKYCYTAEYVPYLSSFASKDYREMYILAHRNWQSSGRRKMSKDTISAMKRVFKHILLDSKYFHVFFSYLYADAHIADTEIDDIEDSKDFFEAMLMDKIVHSCNVTDAQDIFIKLLDYSDPYDGGMYYASEDEKNLLDYKIIYPCKAFSAFKSLPCTDGLINIHNVVFQVERD